MSAALNIFCILLLVFNAATLGAFAYAWRHKDLWTRMQKWVLVDSGISMAAGFAVVVVLMLANSIIGYGIDGTMLTSAWLSLISACLCQSVLFGCQRGGLELSEHTVLLSLILYCGCIAATSEVAFTTCALGFSMVPTYFTADILLAMLMYLSFLFMWHYVLVVGGLEGRVFRVGSIVVGLISAICCLAFAISPLTGMTTVQPSVLGTVYSSWYYAAAAPCYIVEAAVLVAVLCAKMERTERFALLGLMLGKVVSDVQFLFFSQVYITPLLLALGGLGCYMGVVLRRAKAVERHLAQVDMASAIQQGMLPQSFPDDPRLEVYGHMWPAKEVAGDFYDFFQPDPDHVYLAVADVSGKDVPAAMFMAKAHALIREHEKEGLPPHEIFNLVNASLAEGNAMKLFVTAWMGLVDLEKGTLTFANAGHNPPVVSRSGAGQHYQRVKPSLMLGIRKRTKYAEHAVALEAGDCITLYTDGVTESVNTKEEQFGEDRLMEYVAGNIHAKDLRSYVEGLFEEVSTFAQGMEQFDDVTVLSGVYKGSALDAAEG